MSTETHLAFAHPEERAKAQAAGAMLDRISLRDHIVSVEIGAFQAEREVTQRLSFNIVVEVRHASTELGDDVDLILSYDRLTEAIDIELAAERLNLLETLAERVASRILGEPQAERVFVRIEKLDRGGGALGVEIMRAGREVIAGAVEEKAVAPRVVFVSDNAFNSDQLVNALAEMKKLGAPLVIATESTGSAKPNAASVRAQQRIDLLAIEQNAWRLGAILPECEVVATRTEMDWAIKNAQTSIWAPSKFVFDAVDAPRAQIGDPIGLALWLAVEIGALEVVTIGADAREHAEMSCRSIAIDQAGN